MFCYQMAQDNTLLLHAASSIARRWAVRARMRSSWLCCAVGMPAAQRPMYRVRSSSEFRLMREPRDVLLPGGARQCPAAQPAWAIPRRCGSSGAHCYQMAQYLDPPLGPPGHYHSACLV